MCVMCVCVCGVYVCVCGVSVCVCVYGVYVCVVCMCVWCACVCVWCECVWCVCVWCVSVCGVRVCVWVCVYVCVCVRERETETSVKVVLNQRSCSPPPHFPVFRPSSLVLVISVLQPCSLAGGYDGCAIWCGTWKLCVVTGVREMCVFCRRLFQWAVFDTIMIFQVP